MQMPATLIVPITGGLRAPMSSLANHLVRPEEELRCEREAKRLGGLEVDDQLELRGLFHREVGRRSAFQHFVHVDGGVLPQDFPVCTIDLLYLAVLTPVAAPNPLVYQSLPTSIHDRHTIGRRRKDDTHVGTAARGIVA